MTTAPEPVNDDSKRKTSRGKKVLSEVETVSVEPVKEVEESIAVEEPKKKSNRRGRVQLEPEENLKDNDEVKEPATKRGGRRTAKKDVTAEAVKVDESIDEVVEPAGKRGRKATKANVIVEETSDIVEETSDELTEKPAEDSVSKVSDENKSSQEVEVAKPVKSTRGRGKASKKVEENPVDEVIATDVVSVDIVSKVRGRRGV